MTPEDIVGLLTRLGIFPKPMPRTLEGAVKEIERQRWGVIVGENEAAAKIADRIAEMCESGAGEYNIGERCRQVAGLIRARVKP